MSHSWEDVKFLQENWDGPIILKGIQTVEDAKKPVEIGVSSHQHQMHLFPEAESEFWPPGPRNRSQ